MHGQVVSFYVDKDEEHVVMTVTNPSEGNFPTVRVSKDELRQMVYADPKRDEGIPQAGTPGW